MGGNRVPFSIFHVPLAYAAIAWLASVEGRQGRLRAKLRPLSFAALFVLFILVAGLTNDWGLMLLGLPPVLLVLGARRVALARLLLVALGLAVVVPKLLGAALAPALLTLAGPERFDLSNGAYRMILTLDEDSIDAVGSVGSDRVAEHAAIIRRYAQGRQAGLAAFTGDGYLADDIKPLGPAVVQTLMTDAAAATYLMPEFGILGVAGVLLALGALLGALGPATSAEGERAWDTLRALMATYVAFAGFYMIAAPIGLAFFTGKNFPFLSIISKSDLLESGLFLFLAGLYRYREELPRSAQQTPERAEEQEGATEEGEAHGAT